jgi:hypothetical protein
LGVSSWTKSALVSLTKAWRPAGVPAMDAGPETLRSKPSVDADDHRLRLPDSKPSSKRMSPYRWPKTPKPLPSRPSLSQTATKSPSGLEAMAEFLWKPVVKELTWKSFPWATPSEPKRRPKMPPALPS